MKKLVVRWLAFSIWIAIILGWAIGTAFGDEPKYYFIAVSQHFSHAIEDGPHESRVVCQRERRVYEDESFTTSECYTR